MTQAPYRQQPVESYEKEQENSPFLHLANEGRRKIISQLQAYEPARQSVLMQTYDRFMRMAKQALHRCCYQQSI